MQSLRKHLWIWALMVAMIPLNAADRIRVACVGDSITYGSGIPGRETNSYPARLARKLGERFDVRNFGLSGATVLQKGDLPYAKSESLSKALSFEPEIVLILLGTNDSKRRNWKSGEEFKRDYQSLIEKFTALPSNPKVILCQPLPATNNDKGIDEDILVEVRLIVREIGVERKLQLVNLPEFFYKRGDLFPDKVHPNSKGAAIICDAIYEAMLK